MINSSDNTQVYKINIKEISCTEFNAAYFLMSEKRKEKCDGYRYEDDKKCCIAADMLIRKALSERLDIPPEDVIYSVSDNGKPYFENNACYFSVAHSGKYAVVAVNKSNPVGVDIEKIRPVKTSVMRHIFSEGDKSFVLGESGAYDGVIEDREALIRFFKVWTYKEAYVKTTGEGINDNLKNISYDEKNCISEVFEDYVLTVITE